MNGETIQIDKSTIHHETIVTRGSGAYINAMSKPQILHHFPDSEIAPRTSMTPEQRNEHTIFKVCLHCSFDTFGFPGLAIVSKPNYQCLICKRPCFVLTCSKCEFRYGSDCPLTALLVDNNERDDEPRSKRKTRKKSKEREIEIEIDEQSKGLDSISELSEPKTAHDEKAPTLTTGTTENASTDPFSVNICIQCHQPRCQTHKPGYNNFIVDMQDFSKKVGDAMRLCTMCPHGLCPGSQLVVIFRCRQCGHEGGIVCLEEGELRLGEEKSGDEEWYVCCQCAKLERIEAAISGVVVKEH